MARRTGGREAPSEAAANAGRGEAMREQPAPFHIAVSLPESYIRQPDTIRRVLAGFQASLSGTGGTVIHQGWTGRRSAGEYAPWFIFTVVVGGAVVREVGVGFFQAVGAQGWEAVKRLVRHTAAPRRGEPIAEVWLAFESTVRRGNEETQQHVMLRLPRQTAGDAPELLDRILDRGLVRVDEVLSAGEASDLFYDRESSAWMTLDEVLALKQERNRKADAGGEGR
ncbi:MAG: hypothetical protein M3Q03_07855 [Chloroflexota bacterium]|nr:hypothetical protein [Chloroflexota bacterium]